ncbi:MAG: hypothetical protein KDM63_06375 [Verrucomicrobiae bacterium]|nr:hypothetical protein [Verrucomicrobiae bacterium]
MRRKLLISFLTLLALAVVAIVVGKKVLVGYLTPDFLVRQIERQWNCRAQVDDLKVTLLGTASVELTGVTLVPRDDFAKEGKPLTDRPPLDVATAPLRCDTVLLELRPAELIRRELNIRQLVVSGLSVSTSVNHEGDAAIERLFDRPDEAAVPVLPVAQMAVSGEEPETADAPKSQPFATVADRIDVKDGKAEFLIEASGTTIRLEAFQLSLTEIDVNPANIGAHNRAAFQFGGDLVVIPPADRNGDGEYLRGHVSGQGEVNPFDPETAKMNPAWASDLTLHQGAQINTFPVIARLQDLLKDVDTAGVDLSDLNIRGTLLADAKTRVSHANGRYLIEKPLELPLPDTTLMIQDGSWLHTGTNQHAMQGRVIASEALTQKIEGKVDAYLKKKAKGFPTESLRNMVLGPVIQDGKLTIQFTSQGDLAKPKADIVTPFGNLSEVIDTGKATLKTLEEAGKSLLKGLFGK